MNINTGSGPGNEFLAFCMIAWAVVVSVVLVIVHIAFAWGVFRDADRSSRRLIFVGPVIWAIATLFGGVFVAAVYWLMHHSRLNGDVALGEVVVEDPELPPSENPVSEFETPASFSPPEIDTSGGLPQDFPRDSASDSNDPDNFNWPPVQ